MVTVQSNVGGRPRLGSTLWSILGVVLLIACVSLTVLTLAGPRISSVFNTISGTLDTLGSGYTGSTAVQIPLRVIIREGYITLVVEDTLAAKDAVEGMVGEMESEGAFIVSSEERAGAEGRMPIVNMAIRVPAKRFDEVMDRLAALAVRVEERRETAEDVTEEYVDLQGRLASMEAARDRLRGIMKEAETAEELLLTEEKLAEREAEIESLKGRLEYLTQSAQLSRVVITLSPSVLSQPVTGSWRPGETTRKAYAGLVRSAQGAVNVLIYFGIVILPWLIVIGLIVYGVRRVMQRYHTRRVMEQPLESPVEKQVD